MASPLRAGQVVWAEIADANGIRKERPAIIVTPDERITDTGSVDVVAVTTRLAQPLPEDHVLLPWHPQGHPRTGLKRKCAAVCSWMVRMNVSDIESIAGRVSGSLL